MSFRSAATLLLAVFAACSDDEPGPRPEARPTHKTGEDTPRFASKRARLRAMVQDFKDGAATFQGYPLDGFTLADAILKHKPLQANERDIAREDMALLEALPSLLLVRYGPNAGPDKNDRFRASLPLVSALADHRRFVRVTAIDTLRKIYGVSEADVERAKQEGRAYDPDAPRAKRVLRQNAWTKFIQDALAAK